VLTSPDSAEKVTAFYENALQSGGWQVEKTTKSGDTVEYKAIKGTAAVEIEISSADGRVPTGLPVGLPGLGRLPQEKEMAN
jgi:hypothetical protein